MEAFHEIDAYAASLPMENIDTDKILPGQFLKTISRQGLGRYLFWTLRQDGNFVLNLSPWDRAAVIVALENFGCGSSREHAPWALKDFGIRCVISPQIADIFYNNCVKNKILPIILPRPDVLTIMGLVADASTARLQISLERQEIITCDGTIYSFDIDPIAKKDLMSEQDEIEQTLLRADEISNFEMLHRAASPWMVSTEIISYPH